MALPPVAIGGLLTLLSLLATVFVSAGNKMGWHTIDMKWHSRLAGLTLILALGHASYGLYLNL